MKTFLATLSVVLMFGANLLAQTNPFTGKSAGTPYAASQEPSGEETSAQGKANFPSFGLPFQDELRGFQRRLNVSLAGLIRSLRENPSPGLLFLVLGVSFLYGLIHALLPGHRKVVLLGYFLAENARPIQGLFAGLFMAALHAGAALVIVSGIYLLLQGAATISGSFENTNLFIQKASARLLLLAGCVFFILKLRDLRRGNGSHDHTGHHETPGRATRRRLLPFIIFSGMIPCPGASMILVFSLSLGVFFTGVLSVLAMSAGMGLTLSAVSVTTILFKERATRFFSGTFGKRLHAGLELGGAIFLLLFGLWLVIFMPPLG